MTVLRLSWITCGVLAAVAVPATAHAGVARTWVSGVGDDSSPCTRALPCKTFTVALGKTAAGGIIEATDAGSFGTVLITKSITIDSCCGADILAAGSAAIVVNAGLNDTVTLKHLKLSGEGTGTFGIQILSAGTVVISGTEISGFNQGIADAPSSASRLFVRDTLIGQSVQSGVVLQGGVAATFDNCTFEGNGVAGLAQTTGTSASVTRSTSTMNGIGFELDAGARLTLKASALSQNTTGLATAAGGAATVADSVISFNATGFSGQAFSLGNNLVAGNAAVGTALTPVGAQ